MKLTDEVKEYHPGRWIEKHAGDPGAAVVDILYYLGEGQLRDAGNLVCLQDERIKELEAEKQYDRGPLLKLHELIDKHYKGQNEWGESTLDIVAHWLCDLIRENLDLEKQVETMRWKNDTK